MLGFVKKVDDCRRFAFIRVNSGEDVFLSLNENAGLSLEFRDDVEFDLIRSKGQLRARNVNVLDPLRNYEVVEDRHGWCEARRDSNTVIYGNSVKELRARVTHNPGFQRVNPIVKLCDIEFKEATYEVRRDRRTRWTSILRQHCG